MRYGVIRTERNRSGVPHWLNRGTFVRVLADRPYGELVETLYPVFGAPELGCTYSVKQQTIYRNDYHEIPGQLGPFLEAWAEYFQRVREWLCLA